MENFYLRYFFHFLLKIASVYDLETPKCGWMKMIMYWSLIYQWKKWKKKNNIVFKDYDIIFFFCPGDWVCIWFRNNKMWLNENYHVLIIKFSIKEIMKEKKSNIVFKEYYITYIFSFRFGDWVCIWFRNINCYSEPKFNKNKNFDKFEELLSLWMFSEIYRFLFISLINVKILVFMFEGPIS